VIAGYTVFALVYLGFGLVSEPWMVVALFIAYGAYYAMTEGISRALIADLVPQELRATAMGAFATATGLALLPASLVAGLLWQWIDPQAPFLYGAALAALTALVLPLVLPAKKRAG
jgi:MFS family permease